MKLKLFTKAAAFVFALSMLPAQQVMAATTGLDFAGGCTGIDAQKGVLCGTNGNPTEASVAAILGVTAGAVSEIFHDDVDGARISGINAQFGTWDLGSGNPLGITHLSFKADGYFVLAAVTADSGDFMMPDPVTTWGTDVSLPCPTEICSDGLRAYVDADFLNDAGNVADLSNFRGYTVVPVPAAVWLFGSGLLGLVGIARRRRS